MKDSKIQWTEHTWNPWQGCKKVSSGCKFCYMYRDKERFKQDATIVVRSQPGTFNKPLQWKEPAQVFTCSWSDWFIDEADAWRPEAWEIIRRTPWLTYQILTKRPERIMGNLPPDWGNGYPNVWLGVSAEDQGAYNERVPILASIPAQLRFVSLEPLLSPIDLLGDTDSIFGVYLMQNINWIIVGGESGNEYGKYLYRECYISWIDNIIVSADLLRMPVFVKQLGTFISQQLNLSDRHGGDISEFPEYLRVRNFPK